MFVTGVAYVPQDVPHAPPSLEAVLRAWLVQLRLCAELQEWKVAVVEALRVGHHIGKEDPVVGVGGVHVYKEDPVVGVGGVHVYKGG